MVFCIAQELEDVCVCNSFIAKTCRSDSTSACMGQRDYAEISRTYIMTRRESNLDFVCSHSTISLDNMLCSLLQVGTSTPEHLGLIIALMIRD